MRKPKPTDFTIEQLATMFEMDPTELALTIIDAEINKGIPQGPKFDEAQRILSTPLAPEPIFECEQPQGSENWTIEDWQRYSDKLTEALAEFKASLEPVPLKK